MLAALLAPATANATRYASPTGSGGEPCLQTAPCNIQAAAEGHVSTDVQNGDEIVLLPGTYDVSTDVNPEIDLVKAVNFHGQTGQPRPTIVSTGNAAALFSNATVTVSHLDIERPASTYGIFLTAGGTIEEVTVHIASTNFTTACALTAGTYVIRDTVCWNSGVAGAGVASTSGTSNVTLRNVTTVSTASLNSHGIYFDGDGGEQMIVNAKNVIARGTTDDIYASSSGATSATTITLDHSNYLNSFVIGNSGATASVTDPSTNNNQTAAPMFVDQANGDFHEASGSPTINAGADDVSNGPADIDLEPRLAGTAPDIGADEYVDTDGDGVPDRLDACPTQAGAAANNGCPPSSQPPPTSPSDTDPPETKLTKEPRKRTTKTTAKFKFGSDEPGSSFECSLDRKRFKACASPRVYKHLDSGKHVFAVRATDPAKNVDSSPATYRWKILED